MEVHHLVHAAKRQGKPGPRAASGTYSRGSDQARTNPGRGIGQSNTNSQDDAETGQSDAAHRC